MHLHTVKIVINGVFYLRGFHCEHPWIYFDEALLGFPIGEDDEIYIEGHYFYKTDAINLWDSVVDASYPQASSNDTKRILSRHYIDGHFSLDNGLYKEAQAFFVHADYPQPLAGKALVLGCDMKDGETIAPTTTLDELREKVMFVMPVRVNGELVWLDTKGEVHRYE